MGLELKKSFEKIDSEGIKPEEPSVAEGAKKVVGWEEVKQAVEEEKFDAFEFADEKDVLPKYNDAWTEKILSKDCGMKEKKEMLEALLVDVDTPKIKPGDT